MKKIQDITKNDIKTELTGFFLSLVLAIALGWSLPDLVWSMWLSSLVIGFAYIVYSIYHSSSAIKNKAGRVLAIIFPVLFFMVHFGGFHFVHSIFLNAFLTPGGIMDLQGNWEMLPSEHGNGITFVNKDAPKDADIMDFLPDYPLIFRTYFWILPIAFLSNISLFSTPEKGPALAYKNVIKLHLLIFIFAGLAAAHLNLFYIYLFTFAWFFFPFSAFLPAGNKYKESKRLAEKATEYAKIKAENHPEKQ